MIDLAALIVSIALLAAYQYFLEQRQKRDALFTVHAVNVAARNAWVEMVMESGKPDVLAVQTLRNSVMASSFMASTAILLLVGTLTLSGSSSDQAVSLLHALNVGGATDNRITAWKLILLLGDFFIAFFCFSMAVRFYNHVGYMISIPPGRNDAVSPGLVSAYLNRAG